MKGFVEAVLVWSGEGPSDRVAEWLGGQGLATAPMRAGLLVSGPRERFEAAFALDLTAADPPVALPVPEALKPHVASIAIPGLRRPD